MRALAGVAVLVTMAACPPPPPNLMCTPAGGFGAVLTGRFVTAMLFDMAPWGAWSIAAPLVCLLIACALASAIPATRAARIAPSTPWSLE